MKVYKIRHKPTGWYYTPLVNGSNLSLHGHVYHCEPVLEYIGHYFEITEYEYHLLNIGKSLNFDRCIIDFIESDWEIVEYLLEEVK